jgi:ribosomal protein L31E
MRNEQYYVYSSFLLFSIQEKSIITYISLHNIAHRNAQTLNSANRAIQAAQNFIENHLAVHVTQLLYLLSYEKVESGSNPISEGLAPEYWETCWW